LNDLINKSSQTPIEIALGIDENGKTTARKLYEFLELNPKNYSRWCEVNIIKNEFAEENKDYEVFVLKEENPLGGRPTQDFKLTASFAKKLSMTAKNEKGEEARKYFLQTEDKLKEITIAENALSPELKMFNCIYKAVAKNELESRQALEQSQKAIEQVASIREVVALNPTDWRRDTSTLVSKMALNMGGYDYIKPIREESYKLLEHRYGVALSIRLTNKKKTMSLNGVCKSKLDKLNQLDVIADDKKLIEGYTQIIKEMAIKYKVA